MTQMTRKTESAGKLVASALIGAAAGAAAVALTDKDVRKKIQTNAGKAMSMAKNRMRDLRSKGEHLREESKKKVVGGLKKAQETVEKT